MRRWQRQIPQAVQEYEGPSRVLSGTLDAVSRAPDLRVRSVALSLPVEVGLRRVGGATHVLADLPRSVTRTEFDVRPGGIEVLWVAEEAS